MEEENILLARNTEQQIINLINENISYVYNAIEVYVENYTSHNGVLRGIDGKEVKKLVSGYFSGIQTGLLPQIDGLVEKLFIQYSNGIVYKDGYAENTVRALNDVLDAVIKNGFNTFSSEFSYDFNGILGYVPDVVAEHPTFQEDVNYFKNELYNKVKNMFNESQYEIAKESYAIFEDAFSKYSQNINKEDTKREEHQEVIAEEIETTTNEKKDEITSYYEKLKRKNSHESDKGIIEKDKDLQEDYSNIMVFLNELEVKRIPREKWTDEQEKQYSNLTGKFAYDILRIKYGYGLEKDNSKENETKTADLSSSTTISSEMSEYNRVYQESLERNKKYQQPIDTAKTTEDSKVKTTTFDEEKVSQNVQIQQQLINAFQNVQAQKEQQENQSKTSSEIDVDLDDFEKQEMQILSSKHFTDEQKKQMIKELYEEFDNYVEENPEHHKTR